MISCHGTQSSGSAFNLLFHEIAIFHVLQSCTKKIKLRFGPPQGAMKGKQIIEGGQWPQRAVSGSEIRQTQVTQACQIPQRFQCVHYLGVPHTSLKAKPLKPFQLANRLEAAYLLHVLNFQDKQISHLGKRLYAFK
jgi:hypothetical protein